MPQMAPILWDSLMIFMLMCSFILTSKIYFSLTKTMNSPASVNNSLNLDKFQMNWSW